MSDQPLRVAIVGSGPAGIYAAEALTKQRDVPVQVDVLDRLPTPFGLVRYGVAPDHLSIRGVRETLWRLLRHDEVRFIGDVELGRALTVEELRRHVDAVIYTFGAARDRRLNIPGEDLPGSIPATDFVAWYCGHPDAEGEHIEAALRSTRSAVVVGVGNVAVDVARVLARRAGLDHTDMPHHVLAALAGAPVRAIHVLGRRGPAQAAFTTKELRELGKIDGADVLVDPRDVPDVPDPASAAKLATDRAAARNVEVLRGWAGAEYPDEPDRVALALRFFARPVEIVGTDKVTGVVVERTALDADGRVVGTGERSLVPADLVVRSVGYQGVGLPGLPFDTASSVIPHERGRVLREGIRAPGEYVAGWIKRGPTGVIGTNKSDATETVATMLADVASGELVPGSAAGTADLVEVLAGRGIRVFSIDDWTAIDAAEIALGEANGRTRTTLHDRAALLAAVTRTTAHPSQ
jgi:ferredoxin--NADP+ reductase